MSRIIVSPNLTGKMNQSRQFGHALCDKQRSNMCNKATQFFFVLTLLLVSIVHSMADKLFLNDLPLDDEYTVKSQTLVRLNVAGEVLPSYSAYISMNPKNDSALFYWLFLAQKCQVETAPIIVFLEGGPGFSSMLQVFNGLGPYRLRNGNLERNEVTWNNEYTILYIDNPVGTGYSYALSDDLYSNNGLEVSTNLYIALSMILKKYPSLKSNDIYLWGESYGGKLIPNLAVTIMLENEKRSEREQMNIVGVGIGNPLSDPLLQGTTFSDFAFESGLIDSEQREQIIIMEDDLVNLIKQERWEEASKHFFSTVWTLKAMAGNVSEHDITNFTGVLVYDLSFVDFLRRNDVKELLHVGSAANFTHFSKPVSEHLAGDYLKSEKHLFKDLIHNNIKIMIYSGIYDLICNTPGVETMLYTIDYQEFISQFYDAPRTIWKVDNEVAGFVKNFKTFYFVWCTEAGHWVLNQQPNRSLHLIRNFINDLPFK